MMMMMLVNKNRVLLALLLVLLSSSFMDAALRGGGKRLSFRERHLLLLEQQQQRQPPHRTLTETTPCLSLAQVSLDLVDHEYSDETCRHLDANACPHGCCRSYHWLVCDETNAFPDLPCVCNGNTGATSGTSASITSANDNGNGYTTHLDDDDAGYYYDEQVRNMTNRTTNNNTSTDYYSIEASTNEAEQPRIASDTCAQGSKYHSWVSFAHYTTCVTSADCQDLLLDGTTTTTTTNNNNNNNNNNEFLILSAYEEATTTTTTSSSSGNSPPPPPPLCCLADLCFCGRVAMDEWHVQCVPPYTLPKIAANNDWTTTTTTNEPTMSETPFAWTMAPTARPTRTDQEDWTHRPTDHANPVAVPEKNVQMGGNPDHVDVSKSTTPVTSAATTTTTNSSLLLGGNATTNNSTNTNTTTTAPPAATPTTLAPRKTACSDGSWYHTDPTFDYLRTCFSSRDCPDTETAQGECCLKLFCKCGDYNGDRSVCAD